MKFRLNGIPRDDAEAEAFRKLWCSYTTEENASLNGGKERNLSTAQKLVIDLYCGNDEPYKHIQSAEREIIAVGPAQQEFEAIVRARSRALTDWFHRGMIRSPGDRA